MPEMVHSKCRYRDTFKLSAARADALQALARGAMPFIEVAARPAAGAHGMPTYADLREFAREGYRLCCEEHVDLLTEDLENIEFLSPDLSCTQYKNGVRLLVNAGKTPAVIEGKTLQAESVLRI